MTKLVALSEAAVIGLHSMVLIARAGVGLNVLKIAEETGSSKHHIVKVLQRLTKNDYLTSVRGPNGGFTLAKDPSEVSLLDIYETIEGKIEVGKCPVDHEICAFEKCLVNSIPQQLTLDIKTFLASRTLKDYI